MIDQPTEPMIERLAVHLLNEYRTFTDLPPVDSLDSLSDFAQTDWREKARKLLVIAFGLGDVERLAHELAELTPVELDNFVFTYPHKLRYKSQLYINDIRWLAGEILQLESLGDALSRVQKFRKDQA